MIMTTLKIEGMMCSMCEAHICEAIRKAVPEAKKVKASRKLNEATFMTDGPIDEAGIKEAIDQTGYKCLGVESGPYKKKTLFGW